MFVEVTIVCYPYAREKVERALRHAGKQLARTPDSVSVKIDGDAPRVAVLTFVMQRAAQYKVVDAIADTVKFWASSFCKEITIRFRKVA